MRVDIFVYKGHLSKEVLVQEQELKGILSDTVESLEVIEADAFSSMCQLSCFSDVWLTEDWKGYEQGQKTRTQSGYDPLQPELQYGGRAKRWSIEPHSVVETVEQSKCTDKDFAFKDESRNPDGDARSKVCPMLRDLYNDTQSFRLQLIGALRRVPPLDRNTLKQSGTVDHYEPALDDGSTKNALNKRPASKVPRVRHEDPIAVSDKEKAKFYTQVLEIAARMAARAEFWATRDAAISPQDARVRVALGTFAENAARYARQIVSRTDALLKQDRFKAELLPTSVYLRDSTTTSYLDTLSHSDSAVKDNQTRKLTVEERIRIVEEVVDDTYWSKVNTVFAAGQGDVNKAFIRDEVGNWNLKNFSNDPSELLDAYKDAGLAVLEGIKKVATSEAGAAPGLLALADSLTLGTASPSTTKTAVTGLHENVVEHIQQIGQGQQQRYSDLLSKKSKVDSELQTAKVELKSARTAEDKQIQRIQTEFDPVDGEDDAARERRDQDRQDAIETLQTLTQRRVEKENAVAAKEQASADADRDIERVRDETARLMANALLLYQSSLEHVAPPPAPLPAPK